MADLKDTHISFSAAANAILRREIFYSGDQPQDVRLCTDDTCVLPAVPTHAPLLRVKEWERGDLVLRPDGTIIQRGCAMSNPPKPGTPSDLFQEVRCKNTVLSRYPFSRPLENRWWQEENTEKLATMQIDPLRVIAFTIGTLGFEALTSGQVKRLLRATSSERYPLDEVFTSVRHVPPPPDKIVITPTLRAAVNAYLGVSFLHQDDDGHYLSDRTPALARDDRRVSWTELNCAEDGVIGISRHTGVHYEERALFHSGEIYSQVCSDDPVARCRFKSAPDTTADPRTVLRLMIGLFGWRAPHDTQLLEEFRRSEHPRDEWRAIEAGIATFGSFRSAAASIAVSAPGSDTGSAEPIAPEDWQAFLAGHFPHLAQVGAQQPAARWMRDRVLEGAIRILAGTPQDFPKQQLFITPYTIDYGVFTRTVTVVVVRGTVTTFFPFPVTIREDERRIDVETIYPGLFRVVFSDAVQTITYNNTILELLWRNQRGDRPVPAELLRGLSAIEVYPVPQTPKNTGADYNHRRDTIRVFAQRQMDTLVHELVHHWDLSVTRERADASDPSQLFRQLSWGHVERDGAQDARDYFGSEFTWVHGKKYGMTDWLEDMATIGEEYYVDGARMRREVRAQMARGNFELAVKYLFIKHFPFAGHEYDVHRDASPALDVAEVQNVLRHSTTARRATIRPTVLTTLQDIALSTLHPLR